jgi:hypothetical protein
MEDVKSPLFCYSHMNELINKCETTRVVLLIDEAQHLLDDEAIAGFDGGYELKGKNRLSPFLLVPIAV